jgi:3-deoxy-D-manno-octulosonic-acid transferase
MIFRWIYDSALHLMIPYAALHLLYHRIRHKKYKKSLHLRCGIKYPRIDKKDKFLVWIHAVSVGETKAIAALVTQLRAAIPNIHVVISNVTETGQAEALRVIPEADHHVYLPFDLPYLVRPIIKKARPDLVILSESDFWFHFQDSAKEAGSKLILVNGKMSERSLKRYRILPWLSGQLFYPFDLICCQSESYRRRFMQLGVSPDQLVVTGNLKLDDHYPVLSPEEVKKWKEELCISPTDQVLVVGSTHDPEEKILLDSLKCVWGQYPQLKVLIVPRRPERFGAVASLLEKESIPYTYYSKKEEATPESKVILVDAMGILRQCYQLADIAIVGGTFNPKIGGHNLLEPSWYGVPVVHGPHTFAQNDMVELFRQYKAGLQANPETLARTLIDLIGNETQRRQMGEAGKKIFQEASGATARTWKTIQTLLD